MEHPQLRGWGRAVARARAAAPAVVVVSLLASACSGQAPAATVQMENFTYSPVHITITTGDQVEFTNGTGTTHNFTLLKGGSVSLDVDSGASTTTDQLGALKPGTYPFHRKYHFKQGMVGVLTVSAAGS